MIVTVQTMRDLWRLWNHSIPRKQQGKGGSDAPFLHFQSWEGRKNQVRTLCEEECDGHPQSQKASGELPSVQISRRKASPYFFALEESFLPKAGLGQDGASFTKRITHTVICAQCGETENTCTQKKCVFCSPIFFCFILNKNEAIIHCVLFCKLLACQQTCILMII